MLFISHRLPFLRVISKYGTNIISIITEFISVPISPCYFGVSRHGVLTVISSLLAYLRITNLGVDTAIVLVRHKLDFLHQGWITRNVYC